MSREQTNIEQGFFSLIRWCPDAVRAEYRNLGVILVDEHGRRGGIRFVGRSAMPESIAQQGILTDWFTAIGRRFEEGDGLNRAELHKLSAELWVTLQVTEPKPTAVVDEHWDAALEDLWRAYAKPLTRPAATTPVAAIQRHLRHLLAEHIVEKDYPLGSPTGVPWTVDFYANSGVNIALDALQLAVKRPREIMHRAAGEAYKIHAIGLQHRDIQFIVYCEFSPLPILADVNASARRLIEAEGADVKTDADEAANEMRNLVERHRDSEVRSSGGPPRKKHRSDRGEVTQRRLAL